MCSIVHIVTIVRYCTEVYRGRPSATRLLSLWWYHLPNGERIHLRNFTLLTRDCGSSFDAREWVY